MLDMDKDKEKPSQNSQQKDETPAQKPIPSLKPPKKLSIKKIKKEG
jgi:hypothetical protein